MNEGIITMRYARAMFEYTEHEKVSDAVFGEMESLGRSFAIEPRLRTVLMSPMLSGQDKIALLESAVGTQVSRQMSRLLRMVVRNRRETFLPSIALGYLDTYRKAHNISLADITTAVPIPEETQQRIREVLSETTHADVRLNMHVDPDLIGGFVFRIDFREVDASVAGQLEDIRKQFMNDNRQLI